MSQNKKVETEVGWGPLGGGRKSSGQNLKQVGRRRRLGSFVLCPGPPPPGRSWGIHSAPDLWVWPSCHQPCTRLFAQITHTTRPEPHSKEILPGMSFQFLPWFLHFHKEDSFPLRIKPVLGTGKGQDFGASYFDRLLWRNSLYSSFTKQLLSNDGIFWNLVC